jgi:predicted RNA-binding protein with TRAM domain
MRPSPVEEGKEYEVTVESIGSKGDGIAKIEGFIIFVPGAKIGDKLKVRITAVRRNFAIAEPVAAATPVAAPEELPEGVEAGEVEETEESPEVSPEEGGE